MQLTFIKKSFFIFILFIAALQANADNKTVTTGSFENKACITCHEKDYPQLIKDWKKSVHSKTQPITDCVACHGNLHQQAASHARKDSVCVDCHGGKKDVVVHSYSTSKHGVIMQLEKNSYDWQQPLSLANYRAPGCSYCHFYRGDHNVNSMTRISLMDKNAANSLESRIRKVCQDCHAPRYVTQLLDNNESMLEIARMKVREGKNIVEQSSAIFSEDALIPARKLIEKMQLHLRNVYLGAGHQSPDYQWWHGQPALDGDLLRIKGLIDELHRKQ